MFVRCSRLGHETFYTPTHKPQTQPPSQVKVTMMTGSEGL